jgi:hypothetical protein
VSCRLYEAREPACTHAYVLRDHNAAQFLLAHLGHVMLGPIDRVMRELLAYRWGIKARWKGRPTMAYVMVPSPVTQFWQDPQRMVR